jgi:hypothetical protein
MIALISEGPRGIGKISLYCCFVGFDVQHSRESPVLLPRSFGIGVNSSNHNVGGFFLLKGKEGGNVCHNAVREDTVT